MKRSFKIGVFLTALGIAALVTAQPSPVQAKMAASSPTSSADTKARLDAELAEKRARAAKNRAAMKEKIVADKKTFSDMADMDEDDQKEIDARVGNMLGVHPDATPAQPVVVDDKKVAQNKKQHRVIRQQENDSYVYKKPSRGAPSYKH